VIFTLPLSLQDEHQAASALLTRNSTDGHHDLPKPVSEDEENRRGWFSRLPFKKSSAPPVAPRTNRRRTHTNVVYDETTIPYSNLRGSRRQLVTLESRRPHIKGVAFRGTETAHYLGILARSGGELLGATFVLASIFALFLLGIDTDQSGSLKDASFFDCFTALVSLLLTGTDDWAPVKLELDAGTYVAIAVSLKYLSCKNTLSTGVGYNAHHLCHINLVAVLPSPVMSSAACSGWASWVSSSPG